MTSYIIACTPRTGSWLMCECLRQIGVGRPGEYGAQADRYTWQEVYGAATHRAYFSDLAKYYASADRTVGIKLMWWQFEAFGADARMYWEVQEPTFRALARVLGPYKVVYLRRQARVRQAVSLARAVQSEEWSLQEVTRRMHRQRRRQTHYDAHLIRDCYVKICKEDQLWAQALAVAGVDVLCVSYERFAADVRGGTRRILRFLEIADDGRMSRVDRIVPALTRQSDEETETWVALAERDLGNGLLGRSERD